MCSSGVWISAIPFARLRHGQPALVEDVGVGAAAGAAPSRLDSRSARARRAASCTTDRRGASDSRRSDADLRLDRAVAEARGEADRVEHLLDEIGELRARRASAPRPRAAPLGDDVARGAARDQADVRRRLLVDPAEPEIGDRRGTPPRSRSALPPAPSPRARRGRGSAPRSCGRRGAEDDLADRRRLVVDVAELGLEPRVVEGAGAEQADLLLRGEEQLDARVRPPLRDDPPRRLEHRRDGRLVVGAEDRPAGIADDAVLDDGLERPLRRHGVEVRAEEERRAAVGATGQPAEQIAGVRADRRAGVVLVDLEPELTEVGGDAVGDGALVPGGLGSQRAPGRAAAPRISTEPSDRPCGLERSHAISTRSACRNARPDSDSAFGLIRRHPESRCRGPPLSTALRAMSTTDQTLPHAMALANHPRSA